MKFVTVAVLLKTAKVANAFNTSARLKTLLRRKSKLPKTQRYSRKYPKYSKQSYINKINEFGIPPNSFILLTTLSGNDIITSYEKPGREPVCIKERRYKL